MFEAKYELYKLAEESGGAAFIVERADDLAGAYSRIASELKLQYQLGYRSTNSDADGKWRRVQVRCRRRDVRLRSRRGYYAPSHGRRALTDGH